MKRLVLSVMVLGLFALPAWAQSPVTLVTGPAPCSSGGPPCNVPVDSGGTVFFRYTPTGTAILAVSQDATAARVVGISVERISMTTWAIAGLLGGVAGVLLAVPPSGSVTPGSITGLTLTVAFSAAVLGGMTSLPGAFVGGILIGLIEAFANADHSFVPGLNSLPTAQAEVAVAVVLLVILLVRPRGLLGQEA